MIPNMPWTCFNQAQRRDRVLARVGAHASTVSPSSVVGAARAAGMARPPTPLGALAAGSGGVRRPTVISVGQRAALFGRGSSLSPRASRWCAAS